MKEHICLTVEGIPGSHALSVAQDVCALSRQLDMQVICRVNGVNMHGLPNKTADTIYREWDRAFRPKKS